MPRRQQVSNRKAQKTLGIGYAEAHIVAAADTAGPRSLLTSPDVSIRRTRHSWRRLGT
jgi:hypothetical protein